MVDFVSLAATAERLIEANGRPVTFRGRAGLKNSSEPWLGKSAPAQVGTATGVFVNYQAREVDGTVVRQEDRRLLIKSKDLQFAPSTELEVVDDAVIWQVVNAAELRPATTSILWELQVRA